MATFLDLVMAPPKGGASTYRPPAGTVCEVSGPNCDDDEGYVYGVMEILWADETFVVYRKPGCWPNVHKWEHVLCRPIVS